MKSRYLSVKELANEIGVSTDTIRRAYRQGFITGHRVGTALQFDVRKVRQRMQRNALAHLRRGSVGAGRREPAARRATGPRLVTRGRYPQRSLQEF